MKNLVLSLSFLLLAVPCEAKMTPIEKMPEGVYLTEPTHTTLTWRVKHLGLSQYTSEFKGVKATLTLNPSDVTKSRVQASVDPLSVSTTSPVLDNLLKTDFKASEFSAIRFKSYKIEKLDDTHGLIHGELTFLGVTKKLTLKATYNGSYDMAPLSAVPTIGFSAKAKFKRSDWGLNVYKQFVGDEVEIMIEAEFIKE